MAHRRDPVVRRLVLVPRQGSGARGEPRRYRLARPAPSPRSELGEDRHERLEQVAEASRPRNDRQR